MVFYRQLTIWVVQSAPWCWDVHFSGRHFIPDTSGDNRSHTFDRAYPRCVICQENQVLLGYS